MNIAKIKAAAKKYKTRTEFQKGSQYDYEVARKNGILDEVCAHMKSMKKGAKPYWNLKKVKAAAKKCKTRTEFTINYAGAYNWAKTNGVLDEVRSHMKSKVRVQWNLAKVKAEAKKYNTRTEFFKNSSSAYYWAKQNKHLDKVCTHMKKANGVPRCNWSLEQLKAEAKKYKTPTEFKEESPYAYKCALRTGILNHICAHMKST
mgnify:CR=1 FL=1